MSALERLIQRLIAEPSCLSLLAGRQRPHGGVTTSLTHSGAWRAVSSVWAAPLAIVKRFARLTAGLPNARACAGTCSR